MRLANNSKYNLSHVLVTEKAGTKGLQRTTIELKKGEVAEVPNDIAEKWLKIGGISKALNDADIKAAEQKAVAEQRKKIEAEVKAEYEAEIAKLKAELAGKKTAKKSSK